MESTYVISAISVMLIEYSIKFNGKYSEATNAEQLHVRNIIDHFLSFWSKKIQILFFFYG